jgi:hypothetical protein
MIEHTTLKIGGRRERGQTVIIAISVLFIMTFLAALFISLLARNLQHSGRQNDTLSVDQAAQSGVSYADEMLQSSTLGADWRPALQYYIGQASLTAMEQHDPEGAEAYCIDTADPDCTPASTSTPAYTLLEANQSDPDYPWLIAGFSRYTVGNARFLLRVSYVMDPDQLVPENLGSPPSSTAKYIRIESIGRLGVVNPYDPTTFTGAASNRLRRELVAYKPIGLTDYARFITNIENRSDAANLGVPSIAPASASGTSTTTALPVVPGMFDYSGTTSSPINPVSITTTYGSPTGEAGGPGGGALRSNMTLRLYGDNAAYLNAAYGDDWEIAGGLLFDGYNTTPDTGGTVPPAPTDLRLAGNDVNNNPEGTVAAPILVKPSNDPNYLTEGELIRDGAGSNDSAGYPRSIRRLNPPVIDDIDPQSGLSRYAVLAGLAANAGVSGQGTNVTVQNTADPTVVYVPNTTDIQSESLITGSQQGFDLRDDWLGEAPNGSQSGTSQNWLGNYYNPPGAQVVFGPLSASAGGGWGITITRTDVTTPSQQVTTIAYGAINSASFTANAANSQPTSSSGSVPPNANNDIVIYLEGNVRVRGMISDPSGSTYQHVTIVTNGTAYIDGSILKGGPTAASTPAPTYASEASCAILAKQYVCLNTTQFLAGTFDFAHGASSGGDYAPDASGSTGLPTQALEFNATQPQINFMVQLPTFYYTGGVTTNALETSLYVSQGTAAGATEPALGHAGLFDTESVAPLTFTNSTAIPTGQLPQGTYARTVTSLSSIAANSLSNTFAFTPGVPFTLSMGWSNATQNAPGWLLERAAILPADVEIQAMLYAENNSFFVIPGNWFNSDTGDTIDKVANRTTAVPFTDARFPFYGQPVDLQITIDGSVAENVPANVSDQAAWMEKWGWIPAYHGSSTETNVHQNAASTTSPSEGIGLNITYDSHVGFPYDAASGSGGGYTYTRFDPFGRPLPTTPALPVSPDLLYSGDNSAQSLLQ